MLKIKDMFKKLIDQSNYNNVLDKQHMDCLV